MSERLKVALLFIGRRGGCAIHTVELAIELQKECDLVCYFAENCEFRETMESLQCRVRFFPAYDSLPSFIYASVFGDSIRRIEREIEEQSPDVVIDTGCVWGDFMYRRRSSTQVTWSKIFHDVVPHEDGQRLSRMLRRLYPIASDIMIGISDFSARELRDRFPGQRVIASRAGHQHSYGEIDLDRIAANRKNFLFFGRVEKYKGVDVLVDAFELARATDPDIGLTIAGKGPMKQEVKAKAIALGIHLMNEYIPEEKIRDLVLRAGVIVLPYLSATQSGVSAIGLANGMPMVATNVGGLPEHVIDGVNGRVVPAGDPRAFSAAMLDVSGSEETVRSMGRESADLGRGRFGWDGIAKDLVKDLTKFKAQRDRDRN